MFEILKSAARSVYRAFLTLCPGVGYREKEERLKQKLAYRKARRDFVAAEMDFVHRGRFRGRLATLIMAACIVCWGLVFFLGATISSKPFLLTTNITSAQVVSSSPAAGDAGAPAFAALRASALAQTDTSPTHAASGTRTLETNSPPNAPELSNSADRKRVDSLEIDRVTTFLSYFGVKDKSGYEWAHIICASILAGLTGTLTNMLMLCCAAALVGALVNYAVQGLKQSRQYAARRDNETSIFGHRRVFTSLSGTLVTGLGLGFASFLASIAGIAFFNVLLPLDPLKSYQASVCSASLLSLVVALLPDQALLFIESRVNRATRLATIARRNEEQERIGVDSAEPRRPD
jgi:hypothetical protein